MNKNEGNKDKKKFKERFYNKYNYYENYKKDAKIFFKNHSIEKFILISLVFLILYNCENLFTNYIFYNYPNWLDKIFDVFHLSPFLNYTTFFIAILSFITILYKAIKRKNISPFLFIFLSFLLFSYHSSEKWEYLNLPFSQKLDYRHLLCLFLVVFLSIESLKFIYPIIIRPIRILIHTSITSPLLTLIRYSTKLPLRHFLKKIKAKFIKQSNNESSYIGFLQNTKKEDCRNVGWGNYAKSITIKIKEMSEKKIEESFAIGISGLWGSGKTTFMNHIKSNLSSYEFIKIYDFKPWACSDPKQISKEFFNSLIHNINPNDNNLAKRLLKYADIIENINKLSWIAKIVQTLKYPKKNSVSELKDKVEDRIKESNTIVFFIDDLDRLGSEELYEVIKLIRITANFKNIIYIVAYDPVYIDKLLEEKGIKEGSAFMKKIINVEISLPAYEKLHIPELLYDEISRLFKKPSQTLKDLIHEAIFYTDDNSYVSSLHLSGFRDVKRFANIFALNFSYIYINKNLNNINIRDFYLIELLHYTYPRTHNALIVNSDAFFKQRIDNRTYELVDDLYNDEKNEDTIKMIKSIANDFSKNTLLLLRLLFPKKIKQENSIQYKDNFLEYFCYRNLDDILSLDEFDKVLFAKSDNEIEKTIKNWHEQKRGYWFDESISNRFKTYNTDSFSEQKAKNYLSTIIKLTRYIRSEKIIKELMSFCIDKRKYNKTISSTILSIYIKDEIEKEVTKNDNPMIWNMIFNTIYTAQPEPDFENWENHSLLSNKDIEELKKLFFDFLIKNDYFKSSFNFNNILNENSYAYQYLKFSVVLDWFDPLVDERMGYVLLGKEYIFNHLECLNITDFESYDNQITEYTKDMPNDRFNDIDEFGEYNCEHIISELFANKETYIEFIIKCVKCLDENRIKDHLRRVGISKNEYETYINTENRYPIIT